MSQTVIEAFNQRVAVSGDAPALLKREGEEWATRTWREYGEEVRCVALALDARGVGRDSSIAFLSACLPEFFIADQATNAVGGKSASIYETNSPEQVLYVLDNSDAKVIFCDTDAQADKIAQIRDQVPDLLVVTFTGTHGDTTFDELVGQGRDLDAANPDRYQQLCDSVTPGTIACVIYTSGTTGPPKAAQLSHQSIHETVVALQEVITVGDQNRALAYLPMAHIAERATSLYTQIFTGGEVWFGSVPTLVPDLQAARPTRFMAVPRVWEKFEDAIRAKGVDPTVIPDDAKAFILGMLGLDKVEYAISGAAPISVTTMEFFKALGIEILEVYGMTETCGVVAINRPGRARIGTVGQALAGVEIRIGDDGEILAKGGNFSGYLKNPAATAEALEDGWMHTGDLGSLNDEGYLMITGRKKDLIITAGGENISPSNIQLLLATSPYISQALVIGDKRRFISALVTLSEETIRPWATDNGLGELTMAELADDPAVRKLIDAAVEDANSNLARVQQVRKYTILPRDFTIEDGELTPTMKLKRNIVEASFAPEIEEIYA